MQEKIPWHCSDKHCNKMVTPELEFYVRTGHSASDVKPSASVIVTSITIIELAPSSSIWGVGKGPFTSGKFVYKEAITTLATSFIIIHIHVSSLGVFHAFWPKI